MNTPDNWHPGCWVVAPSEWPNPNPLIEQLKAAEDNLLKSSTKLRVVVFDVEPELPIGVAVYPVTQFGPTHEQLARIYQSFLITAQHKHHDRGMMQ